MIKNIKIKTIKKEPMITDKKFPNEFETSSNICEKLPSPIKPVKADKTLKPRLKNNTTISGVKSLKINMIMEHTPTAFLTSTEQLKIKSNPSET